MHRMHGPSGSLSGRPQEPGLVCEPLHLLGLGGFAVLLAVAEREVVARSKATPQRAQRRALVTWRVEELDVMPAASRTCPVLLGNRHFHFGLDQAMRDTGTLGNDLNHVRVDLR